MKNIYIFIAFFVVFVLIFFISNQKNAENIQRNLKIGENVLNIEIADTNEEREKGLSGRIELKESDGMLFVFKKDGIYGIWMKGMNFPLDIAWLDKNKKIVWIEKNVLPESYPKIFNSASPSLYVLETNANFFENHQIKIGDIAEF